MTNNNSTTTHNDRIALTMDTLTANIGNIVNWFSFGYSGNLPYSGSCKIIGTKIDDRKRLIPVIEHISGDSLEKLHFDVGE